MSAPRLRAEASTRRQLVKFCSATLGMLALPERYLAQTVAAVSKAKKPVLVWLQFQDCTGCSESMLRSSHPDVARRRSRPPFLGIPRGDHGRCGGAGQRRARPRRERREGQVPGGGRRRDSHGRRRGVLHHRRARARSTSPRKCAAMRRRPLRWAPARSTAAWSAPSPNPTGALGVHEAVPGIKVINMAGCPHNPVNTAAVLVHYLTFNDLPALDQYNRPLFAYGRVIHDQCERRAHYDAGRFVTEWGDEGHRKGWCLYKMGCKGPAATFNCPIVQWNDHTSWPIRAGHGCIACASPRFWDHMSPFYDRLPNVPGFGVEVTAGEIGARLDRSGHCRRHRPRTHQDDQTGAQAGTGRRRAAGRKGELTWRAWSSIPSLVLKAICASKPRWTAERSPTPGAPGPCSAASK